MLGLDPDAITDSEGVGLAADEGLWFYTSPTNQMVNRAPEEQDVMVRGCRDAILTMIESEPSGSGYQNPGYYKYFRVLFPLVTARSRGGSCVRRH